MSEKNKLALVTGASYGLGYALALEAAKAGYHVVALGRTQGGLDNLADAIDAFGGAVTQVPMDITDDAAIAYLGQSIFERWNKLDLWMHTAWFAAPMQPVAHLIPKDLDKAWKTNIRGTARLIAMLEPLLRSASGRAVFFDQPELDQPFLANIATSKSAQMQIVRTWAAESANLGPDVRVLTPSATSGSIRATLTPGLHSHHFASPSETAAKLWPQIIAE